MICDDCTDTRRILLQYNYSVELTTIIEFLVGLNEERLRNYFQSNEQDTKIA